MSELNRNGRSVLNVKKKATRHLPCKSGALGPVIVSTTRNANFSKRDSSVVSHLGAPARAKPEFKEVSCVATWSTEQEVLIRFTKRCVTGVSRWTPMVSGMGCSKKLTLLLSTVAFIESIVVGVTVNPCTVTIIWM